MTMPSTLVGMTPKEPRYFSSALGFGSQVSIWLMPPAHQIRITERSLAFAFCMLEDDMACSLSASAKLRCPNRVKDPTRRNVLRSNWLSAMIDYPFRQQSLAARCDSA